MRDNRNVVWATIAVAAVMCVLALAQHVAAGAHADRTTFLTFDQSVRLPGVTLSPGTYVFEFVDPLKSPGVVLVRSRDRRTSYFLGLTNAIARPRGLRLDASVSMGESATGAAPPITAWWPIGTLSGRQFVYSLR